MIGRSSPCLQRELRRSAFPATAALALFAAGISAAAIDDGPTRRAPRITAVRAVADAYVDASASAANFGRSQTLAIDAQPQTRAYVRFSVDMTRGPGRVRRVNLLLYSRKRSRLGYQVREVTRPWRERGITFENAPRASSRFISSGPLRAKSWKAVDVTTLIDEKEDEVSLVLTTVAQQRIEVASRETGKNGPRLVLERDPPEEKTVSTTTETTPVNPP